MPLNDVFIGLERPSVVAYREAVDALVGRDMDLEALHAAFGDAAAGHGRLVLVRGEAGIGKTALVGALAEHARAAGALVAWGSAWEDGGAPAYWPWVQVLRAALRVAGDGVVAAYQRPLLARLLPEFGTEAAATRPDPGDDRDGATARFALWDAVAGVLARVAEKQPPLVVLIDDLHAAGAPTAMLAKFVAQAARQLPILLVAAYRPPPVQGPDAAVLEVIRGLEASGAVLRLGGLDPAQVGELLVGSGGARVDEELVAAITRRTEGNPLFVREVARLLGDDVAGDGVDPARWQVPLGIAEAIRTRVNPELGEVLAAAAVLGRDFHVDALAGLIGRPAQELLPLLDQAVAADLVRPVTPDAMHYRFSHVLVADALAGQLPSAIRAQLHADAGALLAAGRDGAEPLARIAHHYLRAVGVVDAATASDAAAAAAGQALHRLAYEEAATLYTEAIRALERTRDTDPRRRCELQLCLGDALTRSGNPPMARAVLAEAAELARRLGDAGALARAALLTAERLDFNAVEQPTIALLAEAADALDSTSAESDAELLARVLARLAVAGYHSSAGDRDALTSRAVAVARRAGDPATVASALSAQLYAGWGAHDPRAAAVTAAEIVTLADVASDLDRAFEGHSWLVNFHLELGETAEAERAVAALGRLADRLRQPLHRLVAGSRRSTLALLRGRVAEAHEQARAAWEAGVAGKEPDADAVHWGQVFALWLEVDLPADEVSWMETTLRHLVDHSPLAVAHDAGLVLVCLRAGRIEEARSRFAGIMSQDVRRLPADMVHTWCLAMLARSCAELGERAHAPALYEALRGYDGRCAAIAGQMWMGAVSHYLGLLARCVGNDADAHRHFAEALDAHGRMGARPMLARTQLEYARSLLGSEQDVAKALLAAAEGTADELGLTRLRAELDNVLASSLRQADTTTDGPVLAHEGEFWTVGWDPRPVVRVRDSKGLHYLQALVRAGGQEIGALDLARAGGVPAGSTGGADAELSPDVGTGADEILDASARAAYRERLAELRIEEAEAEQWHDTERVARARGEIDFLEREVLAAVGLGGRARKLGGEAERARLSVTRAIRGAIKRVGALDPALGERLDAAVRTGTFCSFMVGRRTTTAMPRRP